MVVDMEVFFFGKVLLDFRIGCCCDEGKLFLFEVLELLVVNVYK